MKMGRKALAILVLVACTAAIALPTALWFGLGELIVGGSWKDVRFEVIATLVGLTLIGCAEVGWELWKERGKQDAHQKRPRKR